MVVAQHHDMRVLLMNDKTRVHQNAVNPNPWHLANVGSAQSQSARVKASRTRSCLNCRTV